MILKVTEINFWECEKWSYLIDTEKQDAQSINDLFIFLRLSLEQFKKAEIEGKKNHGGLFAASKYVYDFYDKLEEGRGCTTVLVRNKGCRHHMNGNPSYRKDMLNLDNIISSRKVHSAMIKMRDKKENILYKNFDYIFLK